jgi:purine-nucleoside/S-methyl-5'-thioadenosine phosphorylase / adenosine deaminase
VRRVQTKARKGAPAAVYTATGGAVYVSPDPEPAGAHIWFFTRLGGVSKRPYESLNVSKVVGDEPAAVDENLSTIRQALDSRPSAWVRQVAGDGVARVSAAGFAGEADALVTSEQDLCLSVAVADCVPVALVGGKDVGMVHSGWRGTLAGVSGKARRLMESSEIRAYVGPSIRRCCYEVSEELAQEFAGEFGDVVVSGRNLSLPDAMRIDLERAGVEVQDLGLCTGCRPDLFYSHRKQGPLTGRNLASVAKVAQ